MSVKAGGEVEASTAQRLLLRLWASPVLRKNLGAAAGLVAVFILFSVLLGGTRGLSFADPANLETIFRQTTIVAVAALGMTIVIVSGGIDLSVGAIIALATVVIAAVLRAGAPPVIAALAGIAAGVGCGALNGLLVTRLKVVPFIVTLGTMLVVRGVAKGLAHDQKIDAPTSWLNELLARLPADREWMLFPPGVWMLFLLAFAVGALLLYTRFGRHVFAIGSNEQTARLCGVPVARVKLAVYILGGGLRRHRRADAVLPTDGRRSDRRHRARARRHRRRRHRRRQPGRRRRLGPGRPDRRVHHAGPPVGMLADGLAQLGPGDRHRRHHRRRRRAGSVSPSQVAGLARVC